jgi:hypothetical protein
VIIVSIAIICALVHVLYAHHNGYNDRQSKLSTCRVAINNCVIKYISTKDQGQSVAKSALVTVRAFAPVSFDSTT